jgi:hypothetical protein
MMMAGFTVRYEAVNPMLLNEFSKRASQGGEIERDYRATKGCWCETRSSKRGAAERNGVCQRASQKNTSGGYEPMNY